MQRPKLPWTVDRKPVICETTGEYFTSMHVAGAKKNISVGYISLHISGKHPTCKGLKFRLATPQEIEEQAKKGSC